MLAGRENRDLGIVVFREVLDNVARVDRVLTMPGGSLLMAGRSGTGRRSAVLLVSHMHQMEIVSPKVTRGYGLKQFKNDLKSVNTLRIFLFPTLYGSYHGGLQCSAHVDEQLCRV